MLAEANENDTESDHISIDDMIADDLEDAVMDDDEDEPSPESEPQSPMGVIEL